MAHGYFLPLLLLFVIFGPLFDSIGVAGPSSFPSLLLLINFLFFCSSFVPTVVIHWQIVVNSPKCFVFGLEGLLTWKPIRCCSARRTWKGGDVGKYQYKISQVKIVPEKTRCFINHLLSLSRCFMNTLDFWTCFMDISCFLKSLSSNQGIHQPSPLLFHQELFLLLCNHEPWAIIFDWALRLRAPRRAAGRKDFLNASMCHYLADNSQRRRSSIVDPELWQAAKLRDVP